MKGGLSKDLIKKLDDKCDIASAPQNWSLIILKLQLDFSKSLKYLAYLGFEHLNLEILNLNLKKSSEFSCLAYFINIIGTGRRFGQDLASLNTFDHFRVLGTPIRHISTGEYLPTEHTKSPNVGLWGKPGIVEHFRWRPFNGELGSTVGGILVINHISSQTKISNLCRRWCT